GARLPALRLPARLDLPLACLRIAGRRQRPAESDGPRAPSRPRLGITQLAVRPGLGLLHPVLRRAEAVRDASARVPRVPAVRARVRGSAGVARSASPAPARLAGMAGAARGARAALRRRSHLQGADGDLVFAVENRAWPARAS